MSKTPHLLEAKVETMNFNDKLAFNRVYVWTLQLENRLRGAKSLITLDRHERAAIALVEKYVDDLIDIIKAIDIIESDVQKNPPPPQKTP